MKLGLALSGGGFRATAYHLGVLARLARENRLEDVTFLSTVSGGSLGVGLIYALNEFRWPTSAEYLNHVLPQARKRLTTDDFQIGLIWRILRTPWRIFETKADDLAWLLRKRWNVTANLNDLPKEPRWAINATCYETGKNWRFEQFRMGDYVFGYTYETAIPLSDALAASAGFPGLIGPIVLKTGHFAWFRYKHDSDDTPPPDQAQTELITPDFTRVHLWDGGVYDNHGLEPLHDFIDGWREGVDFLLVSDGAGRPKPEKYKFGARIFLRIITGVMMDQIRSLRARAIIERIRNHDEKGTILAIGNTCQYVIQHAGHGADMANLCADCLGDADAQTAAKFPTTIRRLKPDQFELLFRHGFEVADYTLHAYYPNDFVYVGYHNT